MMPARSRLVPVESGLAGTTRPWGLASRQASYNALLLCANARLRASTHRTDLTVNVEQEVINTLRSVLNLDATGLQLKSDTQLLGSVAELDSMAVVSILTALEERFGIAVDDDEVDGRTFASVDTLTSFVRSKLDP